MRMALMFCTVMGQFEVTCSFLHEGLVYEPDPEQTFERAVNRDFVEVFLARLPGDLVLAERFACFGEDFEDG